MSGWEWVPYVIGAIGAGAGVYSSVQEGKAQSAAFAAEARAAELERMQADLQARQVSALRLTELNANLGAIDAVRAGKNLMGDSPTSMALIRSFTRESLNTKSNEVMDARLRRLSASNAVSGARFQARSAKTVGALGAVGSATDFVSRVSRFRPRSDGGGGGATEQSGGGRN